MRLKKQVSNEHVIQRTERFLCERRGEAVEIVENRASNTTLHNQRIALRDLR